VLHIAWKLVSLVVLSGQISENFILNLAHFVQHSVPSYFVETYEGWRV